MLHKIDLFDASGSRLDGDRKLEAELTLRAGKIVWDLNGISAKPINLEDRVPASRPASQR